MKTTLDHNVIIDLATASPRVEPLKAAIARGQVGPFVAEVGASEFRERGIQPDRYDLFEELLGQAGLATAGRLNPIMVWDVSFWDHAVFADQIMVDLADKIESILFPSSPKLAAAPPPESRAFRSWLYR